MQPLITEATTTKMTVINNSSTTLLTIDTTTPTLSIGEVQLSADRRSLDKSKPLSDAERIRRVVLPANHWGNLAATDNGTPSQGLTDILQTALRTLASSRLRDTLTENPLARTVPLADYTITSLLSWSADTASSRGALTFDREQVEAWYPTSRIHAAMSTKGTQWVEFMGNRLGALAAKNHGLKQEADALKLVSLLEADAADPLGSELIQRLSHIAKSLAARKADTVLSLDDL